MNILDTKIAGVKVLEPKVWGDHRGYFFESYNQATLAKHGIHHDWVQDNEAMSSLGVLRGLHYQLGKSAQTKLVRVTSGEVLDVIVDMRPDSTTYGQHISVILNDINRKQLLVPRGMAHGYIVLSETAVFQYKCDNFYNPDAEGGVKYDDLQLAINWILPPDQHIISEKDTVLPAFGYHKPFV